MSETKLHNGTPVPFPTVSPNHTEGNSARKIELIVLHSTGGSYTSAVNWLCNEESGVSAHFVVKRDGTLVQLVSTDDIAWHAGKSSWHGISVRNSVNAVSIGIEMEHIDGQQDWPEAQVETVAQLTAALLAEHHLTIERAVGHLDVAPRRKVDPAHFPWPEFRARVGALLKEHK